MGGAWEAPRFSCRAARNRIFLPSLSSQGASTSYLNLNASVGVTDYDDGACRLLIELIDLECPPLDLVIYIMFIPTIIVQESVNGSKVKKEISLDFFVGIGNYTIVT